ncbi:hypothetical protein EM868_03815 [Cupriavidus gilardii]|uniref:hypothetical protein n=1 Tax=Cupriavidus gilardii TaxID=82541 RepID=UPI001EE5DE7F|nr:hypothetical protein [Cupriavidus gilardii]MCG5260855.1 hypothetical protein [Cupriavidus gilardii]MDF9428927.1 hypothetical protein [Cupriavidus gilardii]
MQMIRSEYWKNFSLGEELDVSGTFVYNGLRRFHELRKLDYSADLFEVFYQLSVGIERLMKIAIVLLEHDDAGDNDVFERSLSTHNHQALLARIRKHVDLKLSNADSAFLQLLTRFYKDLRYDRFSLKSPLALGKEKHELFDFLERHLQVEFKNRNSMLGHENTDQYKKFIRKIVVKIASRLYDVIEGRTKTLGLYTYELRAGSKAEILFLGGANISTEDVLWKELLVFFMNTKETSGYLNFLRSIEPLGFDPALVQDYLDCFQSYSTRAQVADEMEALYEDVLDSGERLRMIDVIGSPHVYFSEDDDDEVFEDGPDPFGKPSSN